jgi:hypothetical protein
LAIKELGSLHIEIHVCKNLSGQFAQVYKSDKETAIAMSDIEEKVEYKVERKSDRDRDLGDLGDKVKAGAKAMGKKVSDPDRDLETEYNVEKTKEKLD